MQTNPEHEAVYDAVRAIEPGAVITYGDLAERVGRSRSSARMVATILGRRPEPGNPDTDIPWWRVVRADGALLPFDAEMTPERVEWVAWAKDRLAQEGVGFTDDGRVASIAGRQRARSSAGGGRASRARKVRDPEPCYRHQTVQYSCRDCAPPAR
ncbi:MGMT family protein [Nocardioides sp. BYT-33-1]|uniref:MGMT family protein n=1 Tax=Nocardioides sp. BYT-33-1 TaxID=3416952 RepID=UPI003F5383C5